MRDYTIDKSEHTVDFRVKGREELEDLFFVGTPFQREKRVSARPALTCLVNNDKPEIKDPEK